MLLPIYQTSALPNQTILALPWHESIVASSVEEDEDMRIDTYDMTIEDLVINIKPIFMVSYKDGNLEMIHSQMMIALFVVELA